MNDAEAEKQWSQLVEDLAQGRKPVLETLREVRPHLYEGEDYLATSIFSEHPASF